MPPGQPNVARVVEGLVLVAIGGVRLAARTIARAAAAAAETLDAPQGAGPDGVRAEPLRVGGAAFDAVARSMFTGAGIGFRVFRTSGDVASKVVGWVVISPGIRTVDERLRIREALVELTRSAEAAATAFAGTLLPDVVAAIAQRLDVTELILERVDLDRIVDDVDLHAAMARLPIDELVARLDVEAVAARVDLDALIARLDLADIAGRAVEAIDLPEIIRESTGELGTEAVDTLRYKSMHADRALNRWRDRVFSHGSETGPHPSGGPP
jgi:hypothetical protein